MDHNTPRLQDVDTAWATQLVQFLDQQIEGLQHQVQHEKESLSQTQYAFLAGYYKDLALLHYALGTQLPEIRTEIAAAAQAYWQVFRLRGTSPAFSAEIVILHDRPTGDETDSIEQQTIHTPGEMDYSLTNSRTGLLAMYLALIGVGKDLARRIAELVWDPPNARYVAPDSVICTRGEQHLAYALKASLMGQEALVLAELAQITISEGDIHSQAMILHALHSSNTQRFLQELSKHQTYHLLQARLTEHQKNPDYFLDIPGLAYCALALEASIIQPGQVRSSFYLPEDLLSSVE